MCAPICKTLPPVTGQYTFHISESMDNIRTDKWNDLVGERFFFASTEHLSVVEKTAGKQLKPLYLMVNEGETTLAVIYLQQLTFSFENAVKNFQWKQPRWKSLFSWVIIRLLSVLKIPLLQTGNIFFTGDSGIYFRSGLSLEVKKEIIQQAMDAQPWKSKCSLRTTATMIGNLFRKVELEGIKELGFHPMDTEPDLWMEIPAHWESLGDFLSDLSSKYRIRANKVMNGTGHLHISNVSMEELTGLEDQLLALYQQVAKSADFNMAYLQAGYFTAMKDLYGDNFQVEVYRDGDKLAGFTSAYYVGGTAHAHYIGIDYTLTAQIPLYNRMLFEFIREAIHRNCQHLHFGRTATEIKTTVGAQPIPMQGYLKLENRFLNRFLPLLLKNFGSGQYVQRHPFREQMADIKPSTCSFNE